MSDEEDYMSDIFLSQLTDVRPSLIQDRGRKRQVDIESKRLENNKRQRETRERTRNECLQESLKKAIGKDNKGFQMLAKMGFQQGQVLGKQPKIVDGNKMVGQRLTEPLPITIKEDRSGLGREAALRELNEMRQELEHKRLLGKLSTGEMLSSVEFRRRATAKAEERFILCALKKCQRTCKNLDTADNIEKPEMVWFWPESEEDCIEDITETCDTVDPDLEYLPAEKLEMLTNYLRTAYIFCFWCGVKYKNANDLNDNCPGLTHEDH